VFNFLCLLHNWYCNELGLGFFMIVIHPDKHHGQLSDALRYYIDIVRHNNIDFVIADISDSDFWEKIGKCSYFFFRWGQRDHFRQIATTILPIIENHFKVRCFPAQLSSWLYDDKIREFYLLKAHGFPFINTHVFFDKRKAENFLKTIEYPLVFKLKSGAGSLSVKLIKNKKMALKYVNLMFGSGISYAKGLPGTQFDLLKQKGLFSYVRKRLGRLKNRIHQGALYMADDWEIHKNYIMFQEFMPGNAYDTRVVVIGNRAFGFVRYNRKGDFRASGSKQNDYNPERIDLQFVKLAFDISEKFSFLCMAYDFLYDKNSKPVICELSYTFGSSSGSDVVKCSGYWDKNLNWHTDKVDPAFYLLTDFLTEYDLRRLSENC